MKQKLFSKDFLLITFVNFFVAISFFLLMVITAVYAMDRFNSVPSEAGLAASIFVIGTIFGRLFSGKWIERVGRKKMLITGNILTLIMTLFYFNIHTITSLFLIRFMHGAVVGITSTAAVTIVTSIIPKDRRGEGIAYFMLSVTLATGIGPFLGIFLRDHGSYEMIFVSCVISAFLSFACAVFVSAPKVELTKEQLEEAKSLKLTSFFEPKAVTASLVSAIVYFGYSGVLAFLTAYSKEIDLTDAARFFFIVFSVVVFFSRPVIGRLFDAKGENFTMYPSILIYILGMIAFSQTHQGITLLLAAALIGFGSGAVQSTGQAICIKVVEPHRMGLSISTFYMIFDTAVGIGPFIIGFFIPYLSYRGVFLGVGIFTFSSLILYYFRHGKKVAVKAIKC